MVLKWHIYRCIFNRIRIAIELHWHHWQRWLYHWMKINYLFVIQISIGGSNSQKWSILLVITREMFPLAYLPSINVSISMKIKLAWNKTTFFFYSFPFYVRKTKSYRTIHQFLILFIMFTQMLFRIITKWFLFLFWPRTIDWDWCKLIEKYGFIWILKLPSIYSIK